MRINFDIWKYRFEEWAKNNSASFLLSKNPSAGAELDFYTIKINIKDSDIVVSQNATGCDVDVSLDHLIFKQTDKFAFNFDLSLYRKDIFDKLFGRNKLKTGNKDFDKIFGIYTDDKKTASAIFRDKKISNLFLNNPFLVLNIQKNKSLLTFKCMKRKLYKTEELQELLNNFRYISETIMENKTVEK